MRILSTQEVIETDFSLPVDLNCGPIIQSDESSTVEEEPKLYEDVITMESNEEVVIDEKKSSTRMHSLYFIDCLEIDFVIRPNEVVEVFIVELDLDGMRWFYVWEYSFLILKVAKLKLIHQTLCRFFTNNYLREEAPNSHVVEQRVEWLYAFNVHCNSFFPMFVLLYVVHYFLSPLLVAHGFVPELLSNLLFMVALSYYHYLNFLGYDVLPFLERTTLFLYPIGIVIVLSPILILSGFNPSRYFMNMYFS